MLQSTNKKYGSQNIHLEESCDSSRLTIPAKHLGNNPVVQHTPIKTEIENLNTNVENLKNDFQDMYFAGMASLSNHEIP